MPLVKKGAALLATFMGRLRGDVRGNTLVIVAAALIPMLLLAGSSIDISRFYMVKVRLQQACDAGALASRKAMDSPTLSTAAHHEGDVLFNSNFADGVFQAANTVFTPTATSDGQITAVASTRVPTTLMKMFGQDYLDLTVSCDAKLEISNTDVILVLDDTGSMLDCPDDSKCNGNASSKIVALRAAMVNFFTTVKNATTSTARFRIGFVPYSSSVNIGSSLQSGWMVNNWVYQSRVANMNTTHYTRTQTANTVNIETYGSTLSSDDCKNYGINKGYPKNDGATWQTGSDPGTVVISTYAYKDWGATGDKSGTNRTCRRNRTDTTYQSVRDYTFTSWSYKPVSYDVANLVAGNAVNVYKQSSAPTGTVPTAGAYDMFQLVNTPGSTITGTATTWNRCVEERTTVATSTTPYFGNGSYDMDINSTPSSDDATRWRPIWGDVLYDRTNSTAEEGVGTNRPPDGADCPPAVQKLAVMTTSQVQSYANGLLPVGTTFHDAGMIWGVRLLSPHGIFASENTTAPNGKPISRHIIFMTDGLMNADPTAYSDHGYEKLDKRINGTSGAPTTSNQNTRHTARFQAMCDLARTENITVWTVAFYPSNPASLLKCANNDTNKSFKATSAPELNARFQTIASQISDLRLSR
jgi:Flp pilus assembly protein TadG